MTCLSLRGDLRKNVVGGAGLEQPLRSQMKVTFMSTYNVSGISLTLCMAHVIEFSK